MQVQPQAQPTQPAQFVLVNTSTTSGIAVHKTCGMARKLMCHETKLGDLSIQKAKNCALTGRSHKAAVLCCMTTSMNVLAAELKIMGLKDAILHKSFNFSTPYRPKAWEQELEWAGLTHLFPHLAYNLWQEFDAGIPRVFCMFTPDNKPSIELLADKFDEIVAAELAKERYLEPFTRCQVEATMGSFQTSPLSIILKPIKPGKYRIIQNLSYSYMSSDRGIPHSINSAIDSASFPCT